MAMAQKGEAGLGMMEVVGAVLVTVLHQILLRATERNVKSVSQHLVQYD